MPPLLSADAARALGVLLVLAQCALLARRDDPDSFDWPRIRRTQGLLWALAGVVVAYAVVVERAALASFTLQPVASHGDAVLTAWILVGGAGIGTAVAFRLAEWDAIGPGTRALVSLPTHRALAVSVSAAVTGEIVFRGYVLTRVAALTGSEAAAIAVSAAAFVAVHARSRTASRLLQLAPVAVALGAAFVLTGSLLAVIVAHAGYDALALVTSDPEDLPNE